MQENIRSVVDEFVRELTVAIETQVLTLAQEQVVAVLGNRNGGGVSLAAGSALGASTRRSRPTQYCPVPYCRGIAAPVFGMVCAKHKDVPKAKVKKYREALRAKKAAA